MCKVCNNIGCPACEPVTTECPNCWGCGFYLEDDEGGKHQYEGDDYPDYLAKRTCRMCWGSGEVEN